MNKQEYIDTAQALAKIPGAEKFPWSVDMVTYMAGQFGVTKESGRANMESKFPYSEDLYFNKEYSVIEFSRPPDAATAFDECTIEKIGPWLRIDDFSPMSAAKFLWRVGVVVSMGDLHGCFPGGGVLFEDWSANPSELDYNKAILAIGQNAHDKTKTEEERRPWLEAWERGMKVEE